MKADGSVAMSNDETRPEQVIIPYGIFFNGVHAHWQHILIVSRFKPHDLLVPHTIPAAHPYRAHISSSANSCSMHKEFQICHAAIDSIHIVMLVHKPS
mmetsp:Transcript_40072/g.67197  ORF Transcript_40072/g.67197 Transcript_40072/m.67197 type:complete len:98 (-) Transcript_40072:490-783(-)